MYVDWYVDLDAEVSAHSRDALPAQSAVCVDILQSGKVRLINFVEEVLAGKCEFDAVVAEDVQVHARRQVEECIARRRCLCVVDCIELVLSEVQLRAKSKESASAMTFGKVRELIAHVARPLRCWHHGKILCLVWLMKLHASNIAEGILNVQGVEGMNVKRDFATHQSCIALTVLISAIAVGLEGKTSEEDVVVYPVAEE